MQEIMPQDIEVRYILPAIRRELALILIKDHNLSQKETSRLLGLTEAAISQYKNSKRAKEVIFNEAVLQEIKESSKRIIQDQKNKQRVMSEMIRISNLTKVKHILCEIHRSQSKNLKDCNVCFEEDLIQVKTQ